MVLINNRLPARLLFGFCCFIFTPAAALPQAASQAWEAHLRELKQTLNLTEAQTVDAQRLLTAFDSQARMKTEAMNTYWPFPVSAGTFVPPVTQKG